MDAEHLFRFRFQSCVFKFIRHSVDEAKELKLQENERNLKWKRSSRSLKVFDRQIVLELVIFAIYL